MNRTHRFCNNRENNQNTLGSWVGTGRGWGIHDLCFSTLLLEALGSCYRRMFLHSALQAAVGARRIQMDSQAQIAHNCL